MNDLTPKLEELYNEMQNWSDEQWEEFDQKIEQHALNRLMGESGLPQDKIDSFKNKLHELNNAL